MTILKLPLQIPALTTNPLSINSEPPLGQTSPGRTARLSIATDKKWPGLSTWGSCQSSQADKSPLQKDNSEKTIRHRSKQGQTGLPAVLILAYLLVSSVNFDLVTLNLRFNDNNFYIVRNRGIIARPA